MRVPNYRYVLGPSTTTVDLGTYTNVATSGFYVQPLSYVAAAGAGTPGIRSQVGFYYFLNDGSISGGAGSLGNNGAGGIGVDISNAGGNAGGVAGHPVYFYNNGHAEYPAANIAGGAGGGATASGGAGAGGAGLRIDGTPVVYNAAGIQGGDGGTGTATRAGGDGGAGVLLGSHANYYDAHVRNVGTIDGGAGGAGYVGGAGGAGGLVNGYILNGGSVHGGAGGPGTDTSGGAAGGAGGVGLSLTGGSTFSQNYASGVITGGAGGGGAANSLGGTGGTGLIDSGDGITNYGGISGGAGGAAHFNGDAGAGGVGVDVSNGSVLYNHGSVKGGAAGGGELPGNVSSAAGGIGAHSTDAKTFIYNATDGTITGGAGGAGAGGTGGAGALATNQGGFANAGVLTGGSGGYQDNGIGGTGGIGLNTYAGGTSNTGSISGGVGGNDGAGLNNTAGIGGTGGIGVKLFGHLNGIVDGTIGSGMGNLASITGGAGGLGGFDHGAFGSLGTGIGGTGGIGVYVDRYGLLLNGENTFYGAPVPGASVTGGTGGGSAGAAGGNGGVGVYLNGGILTTLSTISGGQGGVGITHGAQGEAVHFGPIGGFMQVGAGAVFNGDIGGFAIGDTIDMQNLTPAQVLADFGVSGTAVGGMLEFAGAAGGETLATTLAQNEGTLHLTGNFSGDTFILAVDNNGTGTGTIITVEPACYHRGTRIRTLRGEVPIEELQVGEPVITAAGEARTIRWLGSRRLECTHHPDPSAIWPIRIRAGAFADGRPLRDLWVSPGHCILVDGVLIQAEKLVNGASIVRVPKSRVEYWHLELDTHDIVLAEGLPAESYLDTGNREAFVNGGEFIESFPDFRPKHWSETCAPLVQEGPALQRAKAALLERSFGLGHAITQDPAVHLIADGERIAPQRLSESRLLFAVPAGCHRIELRCRTFIPAHSDPASGDTRALGICVGRLDIDGAPVALDDAAFFARGWHELERHGAGAGGAGHRWSRAHAPLPAGTRLVLIELAGPSHVWMLPAHVAGIGAATARRA